MRRSVRVLAVAAILFFAAQIFCACTSNTSAEEGCLRLHVRADSDSAAAQSDKHACVAAVVRVLRSVPESCKTQADLLAATRERLDALQAAANAALRARGVGYGVNVRLCRCNFEARTLGGRTYPAGEYDALVVELGTGRGPNFWTVFYPQAASDGGGYDSYIAELFGKERK